MINDVLPQLSAGPGAEPAGYEATALSASSQPPSPRPSAPPAPPARSVPPAPFVPPAASVPPAPFVPSRPGETSLDRASAEHTFSDGPLSSADTQGGGEPSPSGTAPTTPQPVLGDVAQPEHQPTEYDRRPRYGQPAPEYQPPTQFDPKGAWGQGGPAAPSGSAAPPPPDFSSWYDPAPRPGSAAPAPPWSGYQAGPGASPGPGSAARSGSAAPAGSAARSGSAAPAGSAARAGSAAPPGSAARAGHRAGAPPKRRTGLWIALVLLAVLGAGAGAAITLLLRHNTTNTPGGSASGAPASLAPASTAPQIVNAINDHVTGQLPAGWTTVSRPATGTETAGFTIGAPPAWAPSTTGYQTTITDPSANANILIDLTPHTYPNDMLREAQYIESQSLAQNRFPGYAPIGKTPAALAIRGTPGAYWKFEWIDNGVEQEAIDLLFVLHTPAGAQSYALYMTAPASMWNRMRPIFDVEAETFAPLT
jgi:hypothetical protein